MRREVLVKPFVTKSPKINQRKYKSQPCGHFLVRFSEKTAFKLMITQCFGRRSGWLFIMGLVVLHQDKFSFEYPVQWGVINAKIKVHISHCWACGRPEGALHVLPTARNSAFLVCAFQVHSTSLFSWSSSSRRWQVMNSRADFYLWYDELSLSLILPSQHWLAVKCCWW